MSKIQGIESVLPKSLDYKQIKKSMIKGKRRTVQLLPDSSPEYWSYNNNNKITFSLPASGGFLDMENTTICFEARGYLGTGSTPSTNLYFNNHIESIINKVEWKTGNGVESVELLQNYNLNAISKYKFETNDNYDPVAIIQQGVGSVLQRTTNTSEVHGYSVNLMGSGIMHSTMQYLPLSLLAQDGYSRSLILELTLENPDYCMARPNTIETKGYRVYNMFMQMELIECPEYEKELKEKVKNGSMVFGIPYMSQLSFTNNIPVNRTGQITFQTNVYNNIVQGFRTLFKASSTNTTLEEYTDLYTKPTGINNYQLMVGDGLYPVKPLIITDTNNANWFNELLKYYNKCKNQLKGVKTEVVNALNTHFVLSTTFKTFYDSEQYLIDNHEYFLDGIDTTQINQIVMRFDIETANNVAYNLYHFIDYVGVLAISKDGIQILK